MKNRMLPLLPIICMNVAVICMNLTTIQSRASQIPFESYGGLSYGQNSDQVGEQLRREGFSLSQQLKNSADVYTANKQGIEVTVICVYSQNSGLEDIVTSFKTNESTAATVYAGEAATITKEMSRTGVPSQNPSLDKDGNPTGAIRKTTWLQPYNSPSRVVLTETTLYTVQTDFQGPDYTSLETVPKLR